MVLSVAETSTKFPVVNIKAITNSNPILDYQRQLYIKNKIEINQTTNVHSLFRIRQGNPESTMREIFAFGIGNTGVLFVGSEIREIFACGIRNTENFAPGIRNTGNFCLWDPQYGKFLLVGSGIRRNFCLWDPEYGKLLFVGSEIVDLESLIPAQGIRNPANNWNTKFKFHWQKIRNQVPGIRNPQ